MLAAGITGPEGHAMGHSEEAEVGVEALISNLLTLFSQAEAVMRACVIGNQFGCPVFITNLTSKTACDIVAARKATGIESSGLLFLTGKTFYVILVKRW